MVRVIIIAIVFCVGGEWYGEDSAWKWDLHCTPGLVVYETPDVIWYDVSIAARSAEKGTLVVEYGPERRESTCVAPPE